MRAFGIDDRAAPARIGEPISEGIAALDASMMADVPAPLAVMGAAGDDAEWRKLDLPQHRERIRIAVKPLVLQLALRQPLVLVFEDLHSIDEDTQAAPRPSIESSSASRRSRSATAPGPRPSGSGPAVSSRRSAGRGGRSPDDRPRDVSRHGHDPLGGAGERVVSLKRDSARRVQWPRDGARWAFFAVIVRSAGRRRVRPRSETTSSRMT